MSKPRGFTIVELLIVIVVIAILAAISIVAYNGIQDRARKSALASQLTQTEKEIMTWALQKNGESVSLSGSLLGYQTAFGTTPLLRPITGAPDITMYVAYNIVSTSEGYVSAGQLTPAIANAQVFNLDTQQAGDTAMRYRIDTSPTQFNLSSSQANARTPGTRVVGWLQTSNNATVRSFGYNRSSPTTSVAMTNGFNWNFTGINAASNTSGNTLAAMVFNGAHDQTTRAQVLGWLAEKYNVTAPLSL